MKRRDIDAVVAVISSHDTHDARAARADFERRAGTPPSWKAPDARFWVAEAGDRLLGVCGAVADDGEGEGVWWLGWFYLAPDARGAGLGLRLFQKACRHARKHGGRKLFIDTSSSDGYAKARRFYEAAGGVVEGCLRDFYAPGEHMVIYGLPLR